MNTVRMVCPIFLAMIMTFSLSQTAQAQKYIDSPWPEASPNFTGAIGSRTSITVRSIEESLKLYRDVLGMIPFYERSEISDPRLAPFLGIKDGQKMRLVVVRTETDTKEKINAGYIGLTEILNADGSLAALPEHPDNAHYGPTGMLIVVDDVMETYEKVLAGGFSVISAPIKREDGRNTQLLIKGPDGERLWITDNELRGILIEEVIE